MKNKIVILICLLLGLFYGSEAQEKQEFLDKEYYVVDSLLLENVSDYDKSILDSLLPKYHEEKSEILRLQILREIYRNCWGNELWPKYNAYVLREASRLLVASKTPKDITELKKLISYGIGNLGYLEVDASNYSKAIEFYKEAMEISREIGDTASIGSHLGNLGYVYDIIGETDKSLKQFKRALELSTIAKDSSTMATWMNNIGATYRNKGDITKAIQYYEMSLKIKERLKDNDGIAMAFSNLGSIYGLQGDTLKEREYIFNSYRLYKQMGNKRRESELLSYLGSIYSIRGDLIKTKEFFDEALRIAKEINNPQALIISYNGIGSAFEEANQIDSAIFYFNLTMNISEQVGNVEYLIYAYQNLSNSYVNKNDLEKAKYYATKSLSLAQKTKFIDQIEESSRLLYEINYSKGNYQEALEMYKLSIEMRDSVQNETNKKATYKQQMKYEYEKKEEALKAEEAKRILEAEKERKVRNTIIIGIGCSLGLSLVFLYYLYGRFKVIRKQKHLIEEQSANLKLAYNELHELQQFKDGMTGMIVHDLKNPLNAMLGYAEEVESVNLKTRIRNTSRMMLNYVLNMLDVQKFESKEVPLDKAEQPFSNVLQSAIEQIEFLAQEKNITLENKVKRNYIVNLDAELVSRMLVNLLTNAIKYSPNKSTISLDAHAKENNQLEIMVADQGQGIPKAMLDKVFDKYIQVEAKKSGKVKSTGLGLTFCKLVAEGHGGQIWVESDEGKGSQFYFTVPLVSDAGEILKSTSSTELTDILSTEELSILASIKKQLSQLDVMDSMEIMEVLEQTRKSKSKAINSWANQVENAVLNFDEENFNALIQ